MPNLVYKHFSPLGLKKSRNLSSSSRLVIKEAEKLGLEWKINPGTEIVTLTYKGQEKSYSHQIPSCTTALAQYACDNKNTTSNMLEQAGISVSKGYRIEKSYSDADKKKIFDSLKKPLVIKPEDGTWGANITIGVKSYDKYLSALELAFAYQSTADAGVIIEEMFVGEEYRILATKDKVIGVLKRMPANVLGDGQHSIAELIETKNHEAIRGDKGSDHSHLKILIDGAMKNYLKKQNLTLESVPKSQQRVFLKQVSNISQGGDAIDFSDLVHSSVKDIALQTIRAIPGLAFAGIDFMTKDVTKLQTPKSYIVIEVNASPGFDIHDFPYQGKNRHATREFLNLIFPKLAQTKNEF